MSRYPEWPSAGHKPVLFGQAVANEMRKAHADWRTIPVPDRMKHLDRDARGFPIFVMAYRDPSGKAHFTVNDEAKRMRLIREDRCSICGGKLLRGRWFVGGPQSAFDPRGGYIDPPMHTECAHYALRVCPYLASPSYAKLIHGGTVPSGDPITLVHPTAIISPTTVDEVRPDLFVVALARGQSFRMNVGGGIMIPKRPYISVQYWQHGWELAPEEGEAHCRSLGLDPG